MIKLYEGNKLNSVLEFIEKRHLEKEAKIPLWLLFIMLVLRIPQDTINLGEGGHFSRGKIYQWLIEYYFLEQWESQKEYSIPLDLKRDFLSEISFEMHQNFNVNLRRKDVYKIFIKIKDYFGKFDYEEYLEELQRHQLIVYDTGTFQLPHKTFLEYFTAQKLIDELNESNFENYLTEHWYEAVRFAIGLLSTNKASLIFNSFFENNSNWYENDNLNISNHQFIDLLFEIDNFSEIVSEYLNPEASILHDKIINYIEIFSENENDTIVELGIRLCLLLPAKDSLKYLSNLLSKQQNIFIEVIDTLGRVPSRDSVILR